MRSLHFKILFFLIVSPLNLYSNDISFEKRQTIDSLLSVSYQKFLEIDLSGNIETANQALGISKEINYSQGKAKSYFYLARALSYFGEYKRSLEFLQLSEKEQFIKDNADFHSELFRIRGQIFMYLRLPSASIKEFKKGITYVNQIQNPNTKKQLKSLAYENLSISYKHIKMYDSVLYYLKKNEKLLSDPNTHLIPNIYHSIVNLYTLYGDYYTINEKYDSADLFFKKSIAITEENNLHYTSWIYKHWGNMQYKKENPDSALYFYSLALNNLNKTQMKNEFQELYQQIAKAYEMKGIKDSVEIYQNKAILIENELLNAKQKATEKVLDILIKEETDQNNNTFQDKNSFTGYISTIFIILAGALLGRWAYVYKMKQKETDRRIKEQESRLTNNLQQLIESAKNNDNLFITNFKATFPEFTKNIYKKHPDLINSEFWFCAMIFLNFSSKEIAQYSFVEHRSIQIRKSRLRKRLMINSDTDLYHYIKSFEK